MRSAEHREIRSLFRYRKSLDQRVNKLNNAIRASFVNHNITIDSGDNARKTGRTRIDSFRKSLAHCKPNELWKGEQDIELTLLDSFSEQLDAVIKKLEAISKNDPRIASNQKILIALKTAVRSLHISGWYQGSINPVKPIATDALRKVSF